MPYPSLGLISHPSPIGLHVRGQSLRSIPRREGGIDVAVHRWTPSESGRNLDHRSVYHHRYWIQVPGDRCEPKPLRLQRNRSATGERVKDWWRSLREAPIDLSPGSRQHDRIVRVLPLHESLEDAK